MRILLHPLSQERYENIILYPPQSLLIVSPKGSGKYYLLNNLAKTILGEKFTGRLFEINPLNDKTNIGIEQIRELKNTFRLKSDLVRIVLIPNAGLMTKEAQNSLLKLLEEPPKRVHFLMGANKTNAVLNTIQSRSAIWRLVLPTNAQIREYYKNIDPAKLNKAVAIANNKMGLIKTLISDEQDNEMLENVDTAKEILSEKLFNRLIRANLLSKDAEKSKSIIEALVLVCHATLDNSPATNMSSQSVKQWNNRLKLCIKSEEWLHSNIQAKLVLSYLFIML
jgi:DNA polymerase-3 subunit delta'